MGLEATVTGGDRSQAKEGAKLGRGEGPTSVPGTPTAAGLAPTPAGPAPPSPAPGARGAPPPAGRSAAPRAPLPAAALSHADP